MAKLDAASAAVLAITLLGAVACNSDEDESDRRADTPSADARCPVVTRAGACRAAQWKDIVTIAWGGTLLPAAGFARHDGGFSAFGIRWNDGSLVATNAPSAWTFDRADTMPWEARGATGVSAHGEELVYFVGSDVTHSLQVATLRGGILSDPSPVTFEGSNDRPYWPQAAALPDGRVLLAHVVPPLRVVVGVDDGSGRHFRMNWLPLTEQTLQGVLAHVGTTAEGSWVLTYQASDAAERFHSHVLLSHDEGRSWENWNRPDLSQIPGGDDISHAFPIARNDEGADIYYVKKTTEKTICRRAVHDDGTLGIEQVVTSRSIGGVGYPQPRRMPDGRIALMLSVAFTGVARNLAVVVVDGDAPP